MRSKELVQQARKAKQDVDQLASSAAELKRAQATLADKPDDPSANLMVGRQVCFVQGDWSRGLPMLAPGRRQFAGKTGE